MAFDVATLGIAIDARPVSAGATELDKLTAASGRAESATQKLTATDRALAQSATGAYSSLREMAEAVKMTEAAERAAYASSVQMAAGNAKLAASNAQAGASARKAATDFATMYDAGSRNFATQYVGSMSRVVDVHGKATGSSKALTQATLNMSRQFADVGVTAAMGMNPLMILIQQGPQIADAFQMASAQGLGFRAVLAGIWAQLAPILVILAPIGIAIGAVAGAFAIATHEINSDNKAIADGLGLTADQMEKVKNKGVTMGDVLKGTFLAAAAGLKEAFAPQLEWLSGAISATYQFILKATMGAVEGIVKMFGGAIGLIGGLWKNFPAIVGDAVVSGANFALSAVEKMVNGAIGLLNKLIGQANALSAKVGGPQLGTLASASIGRIANGNAGAMGDLRTAQIKGEAAAVTALAGAYKAVEASILKVAAARIKEEAGTAKATKALKEAKAAKETLDRTQPIGATMSKAVDLNEVAAIKSPKAVGDLKTIHDEAYRAKDAMEEFYRAANDAGSGVDQMFNGLKNRDWMSAVAGLLRAAKAVQDAFGKNGTNKTTAGKIGAIAGIADGIGQAIGGTAGSVLSGAAGGAMGGVSLALALGGPVGWIAAAGAAIGGLFGLFGSNSKKQAEKEAARQAAAEREAQRQADILAQRRQIELNIIELSGDAVATLAAQRAKEMEGIDESNLALARQMYDLQDAKRRKDEKEALELRVMEALGDATGILAIRRAAELKAVDATNRALLEYTFLQEDLAVKVADARAVLTEAYQREASALQATKDRFTALAGTIRDFIDGLSKSAGGAASYAIARRNFLSTASTAATGNPDAMGALPGLAQTFLDASRSSARTQLEYNRDIAVVKNALKAAEASAMHEAAAADQQLEALNASVAGLIAINSSVISVHDAIIGLNAALAAQAAAVTAFAAQQAATPPATPAPYSGGPNWESYLAKHPDVMAEYVSESTRDEKSKAYLASLGISSATQFAQWHWNTFGKAAGWENFATGGSFTVGGTGGPDSQNFGPINLSPGEVVNVRKGGDNDNGMSAVAEALQQQNDLLKEQNRLLKSLDTREGVRDFQGFYVRGEVPGEPVSTKEAA